MQLYATDSQSAALIAAAGLSSTVLVKLSSSICNEDTGAVTDDAALAAAMQQAAAQGLTLPQALPTRCWYALQQQQQAGGSGMVGVASVASGEEKHMRMALAVWRT
jgi:hypothetical protein